MGLTPHAFQTNLRVAHARRMLAAGTPAAAVAAACGFADQAHLDAHLPRRRRRDAGPLRARLIRSSARTFKTARAHTGIVTAWA